jgi:hypothetical protein
MTMPWRLRRLGNFADSVDRRAVSTSLGFYSLPLPSLPLHPSR